ncbi:hypothetical protein D3C75_547880 [compost metagenome]
MDNAKLKPTAYMKEKLQATDCIVGFSVTATKRLNNVVPLFTWEQVKIMIRDSNISVFDADDYIVYMQEQLDKDK